MRAFPTPACWCTCSTPTNRHDATRRQPCGPAGRKTLTARRKRPALKRRPGRVVILCTVRDTIHRDAPSLLDIQHTC